MDSVIIHYGEIGIKGKNRSFFEKKLVDNIRSSLRKLDYKSIKRRYGRIIIEIDSSSNLDLMKEKLRKMPGIAFFSFGVRCENDFEDIKEKALKLMNGNGTFKVATRRSYKNFGMKSSDINTGLGKFICERTKREVNCDNPEEILYVEVTETGTFLFKEKIQGLRGLPVGVSGKLVCLISGGLDSPVASFLTMKRGCSISFVHFFNETQSKESVKDKVVRLVEILSKYQFKTRLYIIPFGEIQKEIIKYVKDKYRMIVYRRVMLKIAERVLEKENALGFVTGDSIGQVASQTLENLNVIYKAANFPVFSPLIGTDKEDIIKISKEIGTYEISILPYSDCCSFLIAEHPETKSKLEEIKAMERFDVNKFIEEAVNKMEVRVFMQ